VNSPEEKRPGSNCSIELKDYARLAEDDAVWLTDTAAILKHAD
jgi:hypothetical protein